MNNVNFTVAEAGPFKDLISTSQDPVPGKLYLKSKLGLTGMEVSLNQLPTGGSVPFYHSHRENEELYLFVSGRGEFQVDGRILEIKEGTCIRVAPEGVRTHRNTGSEAMVFVCIQVKAESIQHWVESDAVVPDEPVMWEA